MTVTHYFSCSEWKYVFEYECEHGHKFTEKYDPILMDQIFTSRIIKNNTYGKKCSYCNEIKADLVADQLLEIAGWI